jgi:hypothetical protein
MSSLGNQIDCHHAKLYRRLCLSHEDVWSLGFVPLTATTEAHYLLGFCLDSQPVHHSLVLFGVFCSQVFVLLHDPFVGQL